MRILVVAFWDSTMAPEDIWQPLSALACTAPPGGPGLRCELLLLVPRDEVGAAARGPWDSLQTAARISRDGAGVTAPTSCGGAEAVDILPLDLPLCLQPALLGKVVTPLLTSRRPDLVLFAADRRAGNLAAAVAAELGCGLCVHVERIEVEPGTWRTDRSRGHGPDALRPGPGPGSAAHPGPGAPPRLVYLVPSYGGLARMASAGAWQMATVGARVPRVRATCAPTPAGGSLTVPERGDARAGGTVPRPGAGRTGVLTVLAPVAGAAALRAWECAGNVQAEALGQSRVYPLVVGAGWGVGDREGLELVQDLARVLGAPLVVTRPVVDDGWAPPELLVGQSGKRIRCRVYLAVGISGDPQHMVGVEAGTVVAINTDPRAPIYGHARLGVPCDFRRLIPALLTCLQTLR